MKNHFLAISALIFTLFFCGCEETTLCPEITIPENDNIPPQYTLSINGPGMGRTLSTIDGWQGGQLILLAGGRYNFVFSASDQGGVRLITFQIPIDITITDLNPDNATSRDLSPLSKLLELTNNDESPTTCLIMSGKFVATVNISISAGLGFFASDYGGASGTRNSTSRRVTVAFTDDLSQVEFIDF